EKVVALDGNQSVNYVICHTGYFNNDDASKLIPYDQNLRSTDILLDHLTYKTKLFTPGPMFRKSFLDSMDLFNVNLMRHQERESFFRVVLKDTQYIVLDDILAFRRMHDSHLSLAANKSPDRT